MAWNNMEVSSVETVQDMSYDVLKERMDKAKEKGGRAIRDELVRNFDIAVRAVEKKRTDAEECIFQCDESFRIILSNWFLVLELILDSAWLRLHRGILEIYSKKDNYGDLLSLAKKCETETRERTKNMEEEYKEDLDFIKENDLNTADHRHKLYKQQTALYNALIPNGAKSFFIIFSESLNQIIQYASESIKKKYHKVDDRLLYEAVTKAICLYADAEYWKRKGSFSTLDKGIALGKRLYNGRYNNETMSVPFSHALYQMIG